jgi:hypothetical protein
MDFLPLSAHPASAAPPAIEVEAIALILPTDALSFRYRVHGDIHRLQIPAPGPAARTDQLWRHTCFEAFVKPKGAERYFELNFSPSSAWAAYSFQSYRLGMEPVRAMKAPTIRFQTNGDTLTLEAIVHMKSLRFDSAIGLAAVIEADDGISHWALAHPRPKADFHDAAGWTEGFRRFVAEAPR